MRATLIGGKNIKDYTIAGELWKTIGIVTKSTIDFEVIGIETEKELHSFYDSFISDDNFLGFNVALPWKESFEKIVDENHFVSKDCKSINTVYKSNKKIISKNTDINGLPIDKIRAEKPNSALVLGLGGAGKAISYFLKDDLKIKTVDAFDINKIHVANHNFNILLSYSDILVNKYDLIINATPIGKYYFRSIPEYFALALSPNFLKRITYNDSVIIELNYFPFKTPLLEIADLLDLENISGLIFLVDQALESYRLYTNKRVTISQRNTIISSLKKYLIDLETSVLSKYIY